MSGSDPRRKSGRKSGHIDYTEINASLYDTPLTSTGSRSAPVNKGIDLLINSNLMDLAGDKLPNVDDLFSSFANQRYQSSLSEGSESESDSEASIGVSGADIVHKSSLSKELQVAKVAEKHMLEQILLEQSKQRIAQLETQFSKLKLDKKVATKVRVPLKSRAPVVAEALTSLDSNVQAPPQSARKGRSKLPIRKRYDTESVSFSSSTSDSDCHDSHKKKRKSKKKKQSGLAAKGVDKVRKPQLYPHTCLQYEYVSSAIEFNSLDFRQLTAGELEIALGNVKRISKTEREGRLALLLKLAYYYNGYNIKALLALYASWLRKIEIGEKTWSDDTGPHETHFLHRIHGGSGKSRENSEKAKNGESSLNEGTKAWFCAAFNRGQCTKATPHTAFVVGKERQVSHFCSACFREDNSQPHHADGSEDCPQM